MKHAAFQLRVFFTYLCEGGAGGLGPFLAGEGAGAGRLGPLLSGAGGCIGGPFGLGGGGGPQSGK